MKQVFMKTAIPRSCFVGGELEDLLRLRYISERGSFDCPLVQGGTKFPGQRRPRICIASRANVEEVVVQRLVELGAERTIREVEVSDNGSKLGVACHPFAFPDAQAEILPIM